MTRFIHFVSACAITLALVYQCAAAGKGDNAKATNANVKVQVHLSRQTFKAGDTGELTIMLEPAEGFHINANPPVELRLDDPKTIMLKGALTQAVDRKNGYLSTRTPVRQTFYVPKETPAGSHTITGTVTYFYCSDTEGWCQRYKQPVSVSFTLAK